MFYNTQIPVCRWFLAGDKRNHKFRDRRRHKFFIDARNMGRMIDRVHRELTDEGIAHIAQSCHAWRGDKDAGSYQDIPGFCKSVPTDEIVGHRYVLTAGRYVGAEDVGDEDEPFDEKAVRLISKVDGQFAESAELESIIRQNLRSLPYGN